MFQKYNPNPAERNVGDCVIRAVCKAADLTWEQAFKELVLQAFDMKDMPSANSVWGAWLMRNGFERRIAPNTCPDCYTVGEFAGDHPDGTYVVALSGHVVTVKDGDWFDTWDSGSEVPLYYFERM